MRKRWIGYCVGTDIDGFEAKEAGQLYDHILKYPEPFRELVAAMATENHWPATAAGHEQTGKAAG